MPKQRSTMTVKDVRRMLREQGLTTDQTAIAMQEAQARANAQAQAEREAEREPGDGEFTPPRQVVRDNREPADPGRSGVTRTSTLEEAQKDADAPVTVTEQGKTATVEPKPKSSSKG